jgi:hypothetical protein
MATAIHTSGELKARMTALENSLRGHARSASFGAGMTLLVGVVLIAGLGFYFYYGFSVIGSLLSEKEAASNIVGIVEGQLTENLEPARKYLEGVIKENASTWAAMASDAVVDGMPAAREQAVVMAVAAMDQSMEESRRHANQVVASYVRKNEAKIKDAVKRLSSGSAKEADEFMADLRDAFGKELEVDVDVAVKQVMDFLDGFDSLLSKTKSDSVRLTNLQAMQREILMLFKRAMMDHAPATPLASR